VTVFYTSDLHIDHKLVAGHRGHRRVREEFLSTNFSSSIPENSPVLEPDTAAHDAALAAYWDATVKKDDIVFVLGDTGLGKFEKVVLPWFDARPGIKHLIAGNHDPVHPARSDAVKLQRRWLQTFDTINPYTTRKIAGQRVLLSHFPYKSYGDGTTHGEPGEGRWAEWRVDESLGKLLVHGHTHGPERAHGNQFHVGWDAWGRFVTHEELEDWVRSTSL
jgi:calcineurin-like phosphoesterase family protein